jgi:hypothetical protein
MDSDLSAYLWGCLPFIAEELNAKYVVLWADHNRARFLSD